MAYRIDVNARHRFTENGERAMPIPPAQQETFRRDIETKVREQGENNNGVPEVGERTFVVEKGDTLTDIAQDNHADLDETLELNANDSNADGDLIFPDEVVILPAPSPELVAASEPEQTGEPSAEDVLIDSLYERGNRVEYADSNEDMDTDTEIEAMQTDVAGYLDALAPEQRQDAALRLSNADWTDAGPAGVAVSNAVENAGLESDPVEVFAGELYERGNELEYADPSASVDQSAEVDTLSHDIGEFLETLPDNERAGTLQNLYDRSWVDAGPAQIAIEQAGTDAGIELHDTGHNGPDVEESVRTIVSNAQGASDPDAQFEAFVEGYNDASPQVRTALLSSTQATDFIAGMADHATAPLSDFDPGRDNQAKPMESFQRLEEMTENAPPEIASELVEAAMPEIERANTLYVEQTGFGMLGPGGFSAMLNVAERIEGTPTGDRIIEQWADMSFYNRDQLTLSIGDGGSVQYGLALAEQGGTTLLENEILPGVRQNQAGVNDAVAEYSEHMEELRWLIQNHGDTMTPEQLEQAIDDFKTEKGDDWIAREQELHAAVADQGETLLDQISQLGTFEAESPEQEALIKAEIEDILNDDMSYLAIQTAMRTNPELLDSSTTIDFLGDAGRLTDRGRKLGEEFVTQLVQRDVLPSMTDLRGADPSTLAEVREGLTQFRDSRIARIIGVTEGDMNRAIDAVEASLPAAGDTEETIRIKMRTLDRELDGLASHRPDGIRSFSTSTVPGQLLRMVGAAGAAASLFNSAQAAGTEPNVESILNATFDAASLWQRSVEIRSGMGLMNEESFAVRHFDSSVRGGTKLLGVIGAVFDGVNSVQAFTDGDPLMGGIHAATAAGGVTAALGTGTILGPIGLGVVLVGVGASMIISDTRESNKYDNETSERFLAHSGLSEEAAQALVDQSGDGHSPVPMLLQYAEAKGFDMTEETHRSAFVDWINTMSSDQLGTLRDNLHRTLDAFDGDASQLPETAPDDSSYTDEDEYTKVEVESENSVVMGERYDVVAGNASPSSVTQIDVVLDTLEIDQPTPPAD